MNVIPASSRNVDGVFRFAICNGVGGLIHLRWVDVNLEQRVIHVQVQEEWNPKGKRDRLIPLHPIVEALIRATGWNACLSWARWWAHQGKLRAPLLEARPEEKAENSSG